MGAIVNGLVLHGLARLRRRLPHLLRLHAAVDPARGAHADPVDLRVHARLDRPRRGRPDAPADRAARGAARDAEPQRRPARGLQRDRAGLALRADADRDADRARALAPGRCRCGTRPACPATRSSAAPTCSRDADGDPDADPDGLGLRGPRRRRRARSCSRPTGVARAAREHAVPGPLRGAGRRTTATACCRRRCAPASRSRRPARSAGTAGSATHGDVVGDGALRRLRAGEGSSTSTSASPARTSPSGRGPWWNEQRAGSPAEDPR